jgi:hypothetical protein
MTTHIQPQAGADIWSTGGPWPFTREPVILGPTAEELYELYRESFEPLKTRAAARQVLTRSEFFTQLEDPRIDKYVAWENSDPIGLITLTRRLEAVQWISPEYYAARFPDHWARNAIYYIGFAVARPSTRTTSFLETIVRLFLEPLVAERAIIAYDVCFHNSDVLGFSKRIAEVVQRFSHTRPEELDSQMYYGVDFS